MKTKSGYSEWKDGDRIFPNSAHTPIFDTYADVNAWVMAGKENNGEQLERKRSIVKAVNSYEEMLQTLRHIENLATENVHSVQDGYSQIAEWARNQITKASMTQGGK